VFAGPRAAVEAMIEACRRGPMSARIDALDHREGTETDLVDRVEAGAFSVLPTV
jgi:acylphosphatase